MTDKLREAAQAVLESTKSLSVCCEDFSHRPQDLHRDGECPPYRRYNDALAALEAALAEPAIKESLTVRPWVWLTDEEIDAIEFPQSGTATIRDFVRIIEAKLREKNT